MLSGGGIKVQGHAKKAGAQIEQNGAGETSSATRAANSFGGFGRPGLGKPSSPDGNSRGGVELELRSCAL